MRQIFRYLPLLSLLPFCVPYASAQSSVDFMLGFGTAHDKSNGGCIDNVSFVGYPSAGVDPTPSSCQANPSLGGFFLGIGGDVMLWKHLGIGAEINVQPARSNYGPLQYRQEFYDFNAIFAPVNNKRVTLQLQGGVGGAHTGFSYNQAGGCVGTAVCVPAQSEPVGVSNHFQIHGGIGVSLFLTEHIFIRPQFDVHYVPSLTDQFGSNFVPAATVWVGYNFGER